MASSTSKLPRLQRVGNLQRYRVVPDMDEVPRSLTQHRFQFRQIGTRIYRLNNFNLSEKVELRSALPRLASILGPKTSLEQALKKVPLESLTPATPEESAAYLAEVELLKEWLVTYQKKRNDKIRRELERRVSAAQKDLAKAQQALNKFQSRL